jgi:NAD(P)-dependent dehydrogenase (short-subunit alcohol dehydrogenase family)
MADRLRTKIALVFGAGSSGPGWGNGKATAVAFAREGARVVAVDIHRPAAEETRDLIQAEGGECLAVQADVTSARDVAGAVSQGVERFGRIDILHNNVGIVEIGGPIEITEAAWDRIMAVNARGPLLTCKHVLPIMLKQRSGVILNISSIAGIRHTGIDYIAYAASKGAVNQFTQSLAVQYAAHGIRVNAILPGLMNTPLIAERLRSVYGNDVEEMIRARDALCPMKKMGDAWDVAHAAVFLASDEARYITGVLLPVDGGLTCKCV